MWFGIRLLLLCTVLLAACAGSDPAPYTVTEAVRYAGSTDPTDPRDLRLGDLYHPVGNGPFPAVVLIHGGSWRRGSRAEMATFAQRFARAGYVVFNVDYRLAPTYRYQAQLGDVRTAFGWLREHAGSLAVDPDRIAVMGYSAGAHLALLLALDDPGDGPRPNAVVAGAGPTDLTVYPDSPVVSDLVGGTLAEVPDAYADASPINHVSADDPPVLLYHGSLDGTVDVEQSRRLLAKLHSVGVAADLLEEPLSGHATAYFLEATPFRAAIAFLAQQMPPPKPLLLSR